MEHNDDKLPILFISLLYVMIIFLFTYVSYMIIKDIITRPISIDFEVIIFLCISLFITSIWFIIKIKKIKNKEK
jgi:hypothetical protein